MRRLSIVAVGLVTLVGLAPASFARNQPVPSQGKAAGTGFQAETPIGRVWVGPEQVDGEPTYVRRTTVGAGVTVVEVSTTPFMPVLASSDGNAGIATPADQPASW